MNFPLLALDHYARTGFQILDPLSSQMHVHVLTQYIAQIYHNFIQVEGRLEKLEPIYIQTYLGQ